MATEQKVNAIKWEGVNWNITSVLRRKRDEFVKEFGKTDSDKTSMGLLYDKCTAQVKKSESKAEKPVKEKAEKPII